MTTLINYYNDYNRNNDNDGDVVDMIMMIIVIIIIMIIIVMMIIIFTYTCQVSVSNNRRWTGWYFYHRASNSFKCHK
jgi:heme/copper-type cytochrome/quinol oxidase subunit 2